MKTYIISFILLISLGIISCKKSEPTSMTTQEKLVGKWNWISEITNDHYNGTPHITTYNFPAGDYMEFKSNGEITEYQSGSSMTYVYGIIDDSRIWMGSVNNIYDLKILSESDLQLYRKTGSGDDYYESTLTLKK